MVMPALAFIGLMVLMTLVIALGTVSTNRYEQEQRTRARSALPARQSIGLPRPT
jgi:hypothetical protein